MLRIACALTVVACFAGSVRAQSEKGKDPAADAPKSSAQVEGKNGSEKPEPFVMLPKPFADVKSNVKLLEGKGIFKIVDAKMDFISDTRDTGISWTLEVQRQVSARRATLFLGNLRDARFYHLRKITKSKLPTFNSILEYPSILDFSASKGKTLLPRERFRVWVPLTDVEKRKILGQDSNLFELGRPSGRPQR